MNDSLTGTLNADQAVLWQQYLSAEALGLRPRLLSALTGFIEALQAGSQERRDAFAETFCRQMADDGVSLPLREPLFASIIGPYLVSSYQQGRENSERRLIYFYPNFWKMPPSQRLIDTPDPPPPMDLLAEAFRRDSDNALTQEALIQHYAQQFAYAVHEVPAGVLYGHNGATIAECAEWQKDLALFQEVVQKRGVTEKYAASMRYWDFHFRGYADYLTHREQYQNYEGYIGQHWRE